MATLRRELDGDIVVYASATLVHSLLEHDLVDELRLTVHPVVLGDRHPPVRGGEPSRPELVDAHPVGSGLAQLAYERRPRE